MIIAMMASMLLFALFSAQESAKASKTRTLIAKLDAIIKAKWEGYQTRRVPVDTTGMTPILASQARLEALRDLMRMELPDRWSDVVDVPYAPIAGAVKIARPAVSGGYLRRYNQAQAVDPTYPTGEFAGAECLYMIVMAAIADDGDGREVFKSDSFADTDGDTMPEFIDGWGRPIKFLRWAPGFLDSELQVAVRLPAANTSATMLTVTNAKLSTAQGSYSGGAIIGMIPAGGGQPLMFDTTKVAKITGYSVSGGTATATLATAPSINGEAAILAPDPFDPTGVNVPPALATPSFALYPLIYSAGPDKCYAVMADQGNAGFHYADSTNLLNPFIVITETTITPPVTGLVGTPRNDKDEPNYVVNGWRDNIHNHLIGQK